MRLNYDTDTREWLVQDGENLRLLKDVYLEKRKASGKTVTALEREMGVSGRSLYYLEHAYHTTGKPNVTVGLLIRALDHLGYDINIQCSGNTSS